MKKSSSKKDKIVKGKEVLASCVVHAAGCVFGIYGLRDTYLDTETGYVHFTYKEKKYKAHVEEI